MAVTPVSVARVSQNLRAFNLLNTVRGSQLGLFRVQNQLATGLRFQAPSEDPLRAASAGRLDRHMDVLTQVDSNLRTARAVLTEADQAMAHAGDLMRDAQTIASQAAGDILSTDERRSLAQVISGIIDQAIAVGNRRYLDSYLFSGHQGELPPFELQSDGVVYHGDRGRRETIIDTDLSEDSFTVSGAELFGTISTRVVGLIDLDPALTPATRIADLRGANGQGVSLGRIQVSDGAQTVTIDLSNAATVGDVLDMLNASLPATLQATLAPRSLNISAVSGAPQITVRDTTGGHAAADLGILAQTPVLAVFGQDVDALLTPRSTVNSLIGGAGVNLAGTFTIRNGTRTASIDLSAASTMEDVLNRINESDAAVWARIADDGERIEVLSRLSGAELRIEENGAQTATLLGIRSLNAATPLSALNDGLGVDSVPGADMRITTASGAQIDIDIDALNLGSATLQDVLNLFNTAGGGAISAALRSSGNGIVITDNTAGAGVLRIERLNVSPALDSLGLVVAATGNQLIGQDVNPVRVDSAFTALLELREGLEQDDRRAVTAAGERLERAMRGVQASQGRIASMARAMDDRAERITSETTATRVLQSDVRDVDLAEAVVRFQQLQTALQANLSTASRVLGLSLLDFLR